MGTKLTHLVPPPAFDAESDKSSLAQRWKAWRERFDMYLLAANITDAKQKRALLLYVADTGTNYKTAAEKPRQIRVFRDGENKRNGYKINS
jgi:hypothetical protein